MARVRTAAWGTLVLFLVCSCGAPERTPVASARVAVDPAPEPAPAAVDVAAPFDRAILTDAHFADAAPQDEAGAPAPAAPALPSDVTFALAPPVLGDVDPTHDLAISFSPTELDIFQSALDEPNPIVAPIADPIAPPAAPAPR